MVGSVMSMDAETVIVFASVFFGAVGSLIGIYALVYLNIDRSRSKSEIETKDALVNELTNRNILLEAERDKQNLVVKEQRSQIVFLTKRVDELENKQRDLELMLHGALIVQRSDGKITAETYKEPNTLLIATDPYIQQLDEIALSKAGVNYRRITTPTKRKIEQELRRARQQNYLYKNVMISGHANQEGFLLPDQQQLDAYWLNQNLAGVDIVVLNGCKTTKLGDALVEVVGCVVSLLEEVPNDVAQGFAEVFWRNIQDSEDAQYAFSEAVQSEPTIKPYAYLVCS